MGVDAYKFKEKGSAFDYIFESIGKKGIIKKLVNFKRIGDGVFNLGFGDLDEKTGKVRDDVVTDNGDTEKVLATVASIAYKFTELFRGVALFFKGTTPAKTRLYQMTIGKFWDIINPLFEVHGLKAEEWELFEKNVNYDAFLARRHDGAFFYAHS